MSYLQVILEQLVDSNGHNTEATPPRRQYVEMNSRYIHALKETREWSFLLGSHGLLSCHRRSASVSLEAPQGRLWCCDRRRTLPLWHSLMNIQCYLLYHRHSSGHINPLNQPRPVNAWFVWSPSHNHLHFDTHLHFGWWTWSSILSANWNLSQPPTTQPILNQPG